MKKKRRPKNKYYGKPQNEMLRQYFEARTTNDIQTIKKLNPAIGALAIRMSKGILSKYPRIVGQNKDEMIAELSFKFCEIAATFQPTPARTWFYSYFTKSLENRIFEYFKKNNPAYQNKITMEVPENVVTYNGASFSCFIEKITEDNEDMFLAMWEREKEQTKLLLNLKLARGNPVLVRFIDILEKEDLINTIIEIKKTKNQEIDQRKLHSHSYYNLMMKHFASEIEKETGIKKNKARAILKEIFGQLDKKKLGSYVNYITLLQVLHEKFNLLNKQSEQEINKELVDFFKYLKNCFMEGETGVDENHLLEVFPPYVVRRGLKEISELVRDFPFMLNKEN